LELLDLNFAVRNTTQMLRSLVRANITLAVELSPARLLVEVDRGQIEQVLMNLVVNASDAMPEGGVLTIRTADTENEKVLLSVEDTGQGIPDAIRGRIFEPFFTTKGAGKGTGLGLSVVHGIVTSHGGHIEVDSTAGGGSAFKVALPKVAAGKSAPAQEVDTATPPMELGRGERILVVEDGDGTRDGLRQILETLSYEVVAVGNAEEAVAVPATRPFDALLTDLALPGMGGAELAQLLQERWPTLKVILMSGYAEDEAVRRWCVAGYSRFLQKPFDMAVLARELRAALDG
jgi:CheY-like chemotaxis protein